MQNLLINNSELFLATKFDFLVGSWLTQNHSEKYLLISMKKVYKTKEKRVWFELEPMISSHRNIA